MKFILVGKNNGQRIILWSRVFLWALLVGVASFLGAVLLLVQFADSLPDDAIPFAFFGFIAAASISFVAVPLVRRLRGPLERLPDVEVAPESRSFFQRLFNRQTLRRSAFALACLATLVALFYAVENWRGRHALENYQRTWEAKGEKFHWRDFVPPPVPDAENFALTPLLKPLFDYDGSVHPVRWNDTNGNNRFALLNASLTTATRETPATRG